MKNRMRAMVLNDPRAASGAVGLVASERPIPRCGAEEVLIHVRVCGVCRTDLDLLQGRVIAPRYPLVPGHQIVGTIVGIGAKAADHRRIGDRVGVAWIRCACGECRWCRDKQENLCPHFEATGCDADGGFAEWVATPAEFTYRIPRQLDDVHAAPLLCAGAIGWRSLRLANLGDGDPLGLTGFGASAHLVLQIARVRYPRSPIYVFARSEAERQFARNLGAAWAGDPGDTAPTPLAAIIDTTPAWKPVVEALPQLMPGGRLVINAIRKDNADRDELARINYATDLWMERQIRSVANVTRLDVKEMLEFAASAQLKPTVDVLTLDEANVALERLATGTAARGATVLLTDKRHSTPGNT